MDDDLRLTPAELANMFRDATQAARFPPVLNIDEAADLLRTTKDTVYDWRSRGLLKGCCRKVGKSLRFIRDRLLVRVFNEGLTTEN
jgi:hypothetical protein